MADVQTILYNIVHVHKSKTKLLQVPNSFTLHLFEQQAPVDRPPSEKLERCPIKSIQSEKKGNHFFYLFNTQISNKSILRVVFANTQIRADTLHCLTKHLLVFTSSTGETALYAMRDARTVAGPVHPCNTFAARTF